MILFWEFLLALFACAIAILAFLWAWKKKPIFRLLRAGAIFAWLFSYARQQEAAVKEKETKQ